MSMIGEAAISAFFGALFTKFSSTEFKIATTKEVREEIENWAKIWQDLRHVLADAEGRQMKDKAVKEWYADLQSLAYDVDDILDESQTANLGRKLIKEHQASASKSKVHKFLPTIPTWLKPNTIMFNKETMSKIKDVTKTLKKLETRKGTLELIGVREPKIISSRSQSTSVVNEAQVCGRTVEKKKILDMVLTDKGATNSDGVSVIPIVGMGGIGKTTLAQLVYNESEHYFDRRAWACVSEEFDMLKLTTVILQSFTSQPCDSKDDLNLLQVKLKENLSGKKFLLVLDDIWNKSYEDWTKFQAPFLAGAPGSKIIVTTRDHGVSSMMKTVPEFALQKLSENDSLSLLAQHAIGARDFSGHPDLKQIGVEIVKKCDGLPLAIKTIGGLLRGKKMDGVVWNDILKSEIWNLHEVNNDIVPALWLSYYHLSSQLKQCFAYCSLIPKDYEFKEEKIIQLWMAEGFLNIADTKREVKDCGRMCFKELVSRSFFQESSMKKSHFVMHDLINDLARSVAGKICFRMEGSHDQMKFPRDIRHLSYLMNKYEGIKKFECFSQAKNLRTFLPFYKKSNYLFREDYFLSYKVLTDFLMKFRCLRVLSLKGYNVYEIPDSIENLKLLRYSDFSRTTIQSLPDSICNLYNLETLKLKYCQRLEKLPSSIWCLINLCHLDFTGSAIIKEMPSGVDKLTNLQVLSDFIVAHCDGGLNLREMQNLSNLKGRLSISGLQNVHEAENAKEAKLSNKSNLDDLKLSWTEDFDANLRKKDVEIDVLTWLQPYEKLKGLTINHYAGTTFPTWLSDPTYEKLQSLRLEGCPNCTSLPAVGKLPHLKYLYIKGMNSVVTVGNELYGANRPYVFPFLETLHFEDMPEWEVWKPYEVDEQGKMFHCLQQLCIKNCPKLLELLPVAGFGSLEKLEVWKCEELELKTSNLSMLRELIIDGCKRVVFGSYIDLCSIEFVRLSGISKFACEAKDMMMTESMRMKSFYIDGCYNDLSTLWQTKRGWLAPLSSLRSLSIDNCLEVVRVGAAVTNTETKEEQKGHFQLDIPCNIELLSISNLGDFEKFSTSFQNFTCLGGLCISWCGKLVSVELDNLPPTLRSLSIKYCDNLQCISDESNTSLLKSLDVSECNALKSISPNGKLPVLIESLFILLCPELEFVVEEIGDNTCLKCIMIFGCGKIKGMEKLSRLQIMKISYCPDLVCPQDALSKLYSLQDLQISRCPRLESIFYEREGGLGLPISLTSLEVDGHDLSKAVMEWGLHKLTSLKELRISDCIDEMEMKLPPSLTILSIQNFTNLRKLSSHIFQNLTSLELLIICNCPKLKSLPKKEMLPSLMDLYISNCPELKKRCQRDKGKLWSNIAHISRVEIDHKSIYELSSGRRAESENA